MIRSMTGYGQASAELEDVRVSVVLRAVNHRYGDVRLRLPPSLQSKEAELRRKVLARVRRGRVEGSIELEPIAGSEPQPALNRGLVKAVVEAARTLGGEYDVPGQVDLRTLLKVPGLFQQVTDQPRLDEAVLPGVLETLSRALESLDAERLREGAHLAEEMSTRLRVMQDLAQQIERQAAAQPPKARQRLLERLASLAPEVELDPARLAQEVVLLADRADVTEEVVRLAGHLQQARELLEAPDGEPLGKRLDFLLQEINRETNTINSKSSDLELSRRALELKAEIEKVREQAQNLE